MLHPLFQLVMLLLQARNSENMGLARHINSSNSILIYGLNSAKMKAVIEMMKVGLAGLDLTLSIPRFDDEGFEMMKGGLP